MFVFLLSMPLFIQKLINITKIECNSQFGDCPDQIAYSLQHIANRNYKDAIKLTKDFFESNILINNYLIQYKFPSTLNVELDIKKSKYAVKNNLNNKYYLLGSDGMVLEEQDKSNLVTLLVSNNDLHIGKQVDERYLFMLKILDNLNYLYSINVGELEKDYLKVKNNEGVTVLIPASGDLEYIIGSIRLIFSRLNKGDEGIRMDEISVIDLRFNNPILKK